MLWIYFTILLMKISRSKWPASSWIAGKIAEFCLHLRFSFQHPSGHKASICAAGSLFACGALPCHAGFSIWFCLGLLLLFTINQLFQKALHRSLLVFVSLSLGEERRDSGRGDSREHCIYLSVFLLFPGLGVWVWVFRNLWVFYKSASASSSETAALQEHKPAGSAMRQTPSTQREENGSPAVVELGFSQFRSLVWFCSRTTISSVISLAFRGIGMIIICQN